MPRSAAIPVEDHHDFCVVHRGRWSAVGDQERRVAGNRQAIITADKCRRRVVRVSGHPLFGIANLHSAQQLQRLRAASFAAFAYVQ